MVRASMFVLIACIVAMATRVVVADEPTDHWHKDHMVYYNYLPGTSAICGTPTAVGDDESGTTTTTTTTGTNDRREFPWIVSVFTHNGGKFQRYCTGTLITNSLVLTAASCLNERAIVSVGGGTIYARTIAGDGATHVDVSEQHPHPNFEANGEPDFDVALLVLSNPVVMSQRILPICLFDHALPALETAALNNTCDKMMLTWSEHAHSKYELVGRRVPLVEELPENCPNRLAMCMRTSALDELSDLDYGTPVMMRPQGGGGGWHLRGIAVNSQTCWSESQGNCFIATVDFFDDRITSWLYPYLKMYNPYDEYLNITMLDKDCADECVYAEAVDMGKRDEY